MIPGSDRWCSRTALCALFAIVLVGSAQTAGAQDGASAADAPATSAARALFTEGVAFARAGAYADAVDRFRRAQALHPAPTIAFNLGSALLHVGALVEGLETLERVLHDPATPAELVEPARQLRDQAAPRLARLTLEVVGDATGTRVEVDAREAHAAELDVAVPIDPGSHDIRVLRGEETVAHDHVSLAEGESRTVSLVVPPLVATSVEPAHGDDTGWIVLGVVLAVVGVAAITTTIVVLTLPTGQATPVAGNTMPTVLTW